MSNNNPTTTQAEKGTDLKNPFKASILIFLFFVFISFALAIMVNAKHTGDTNLLLVGLIFLAISVNCIAGTINIFRKASTPR
ncbi:hypothetical protein QWY86_03170 [Pedobacter aquatilis]|uniref:hypothetical protein n=1 Tax=Pedobacter aquatilis TaxID=351343 RepID=UPI0025B59946|nr:hypothetical protein [Pedobacter aquatilis]MDN3585652.1 hypothetical protein [Pedobacter aquatilis]